MCIPEFVQKIASALPGHEGGSGGDVEIRETHISWVFLTGTRAYKLKKPLKLPHLDFSTPERRRHFCDEEYRLNLRLAAETYLGVAPVFRTSDGGIRLGDGDVPLDWLVMMNRLPAAQMLDARIAAGSVGSADVERIADRLDRFYRSLPPEAAAAAGADYLRRLRRELAADRRLLRDPRFGIAGRMEPLVAATRRALDALAGEMTARAERGCVVEGHGDLRPEHVWLGEPLQIIDCLEFDRNFRLLDPYDEVRGLGLECSVLGAGWIGEALLERFCRQFADPPSTGLLACYAALRALTRARLCLAHLLDKPVRKPEKWAPLAQLYLREAERACVSLPAR